MTCARQDTRVHDDLTVSCDACDWRRPRYGNTSDLSYAIALELVAMHAGPVSR